MTITPTIKTALKDVVLPDDIKRGELLIHNGKPYVITDVQRITEPFSKRPGIAARIDRETVAVFLVLTCTVCSSTQAIKQSASMQEVEWIEIRWRGEYHWLCPVHAAPVTDEIERNQT